MKTKKLPSILLLLTSACLLLSFTADDDPITKLLKSFQQYFATNTQEKIYLHTDKPYYAVGDDIWFKAYVVDAQNLKPAPNSNILYVDLIDAQDSVQKTLRLPLVAGLGWGNFELKDSIKEGNYRLRAYTTWMRNYDQAFFYDKTFKVGNVWANQLITKANYSFSKDEKSEKVNSKINFGNLDGYPYANKEVTYNVVTAGKIITKGKTKTDEKGNINLDFANDKASFGNNSRINATIKIGENTLIEKIIPIKNTSTSVDVQFFPEGGNLVQGIRSRVAFKALGADGLGKKISGYVQDNEGNKIALFSTRHLGMGTFSLSPIAGKTYEAVVKFEDGSEKNIKLPIISEEGATLSVNNLMKDSITVRVAVNTSFLQKNANKSFTVVAQNSGNIIYTAKSQLTSSAFAAKLDKSRFLAGINQFTLFDENMQPVAERLIFIAPTDTIALRISTDKKSYTQRGKTTLAVQSKENGKPVMGVFSVSVVDEGKVNIPTDEEETIFTNLLLTSDIKGYVENPNYYFSNITEDKIMDMDVLMLTQGWRRFNWKNLNETSTLTFKPEKTLSISGRVTRGKDKPVADGTVTIFSSGKKPLLIQTKTNALGEFMVDSLYFPDSTRFMVQARNIKDRKFVEIELYNSTFPVVVKNKNEADLTVNINDSMSAYLKNSKSQYEAWLKNGIVNRSILLGEVVVVDKKPVVNENSSNLNGAGNADRVLTEKDLENAFSIEQAIQGRVAGLTINNGIAYIRGSEAQIIVDGMPMDAESLNTIPIQDVESIEILKTIAYTAIYGSRGGGGVIIINTKRGQPGFVSKVFVPGVLTYQPIGFLNTKEFYVPNYADPKLNTAVPDLRTTIYWNPNIITDSLGNASVSFYNGDNTGKYRVVLEGTDLNGHLGRQVINYNVMQNK